MKNIDSIQIFEKIILKIYIVNIASMPKLYKSQYRNR